MQCTALAARHPPSPCSQPRRVCSSDVNVMDVRTQAEKNGSTGFHVGALLGSLVLKNAVMAEAYLLEGYFHSTVMQITK